MEYGFAFFPGQGAQHPAMGKDLYENNAAAKEIFDRACTVAQTDVRALCFESTQEELNRTVHSQIAIFTHSFAAYAALLDAGIRFRACAGFSLGEYTALVASGILSFEDGIRLVLRRGQLMQQAADSMDGCMAAVLGLSDEAVEQACASVSGVVFPVNYNCPNQLVIAGERSAVEQAIAACKEAGARRALPLAVSGAFHTSLMADAAKELRAFAETLSVHTPTMPIYSNVTGNLLMLTDLPLHLEKHMCSPVRWKELVANGMAAGLCSGVEIGPGKTLAGFAKKISKDFAIRTVETTEELYAAAQNI
ncbi:MAG: ACP S-malonyltransferase [Butyricicoccus pullicaecorum]|nr:ACP S-malonyltransferase [Butyricicoccus pullicaecorum]